MPSEIANRSIPAPKTLPIPCPSCQQLFQDQAAHDAHKAEVGICLHPAYSGLEPGRPVQVWRLAINPVDNTDEDEDYHG